MSVSYKDGKIMSIISEFIKITDQQLYSINGIDITKAVFFYKKEFLTYEVIPLGDFEVLGTEIDNRQINITNLDLLAIAESFQICYEEVNSSSPYEPPVQQTDPEILKDNYNKLQSDFTILWTYVKNLCMVTDDNNIANILPKIEEDEMWVKTIDGFRALNIRAFEIEVGTFWENFDTRTDDAEIRLDNYELAKEIEIDEHITNISKPDVKSYGESQMNLYMTSDIEILMDAYRGLKEGELDVYEVAKEGELEVFKDAKVQDLDDKFNQLQFDNGVIPAPTVSLHDLSYGRWWTGDVTQFLDCPVDLPIWDRQGVVEVTIINSLKILKYYSTTATIHFQLESSVGVWTIWSETGGKNISITPVGLLGVDFKFAPIMWDGVTNAYVKADTVHGAECIAVNCDTNGGIAYYGSRVAIPIGSTDDQGQNYVDGDFYFLSQTIVGKFQRAKPTTGVWQVCFQVMTYNATLYAMIGIQPAEDISPVILKDGEIERIALKTDVEVNTNLINTNAINIANNTALVRTPVGSVTAYVGASAPTNWLLCNGATFSNITYPALYSILGSTTLPDLRGEFIRGLDNGRGIDIGRGLLTFQTDLLGTHYHSQPTHYHTQVAHIHGQATHYHTQPTHTHTYLKGSAGGGGGTGSLDRGTTTGTTNAGGGNNTNSGGGNNTYSGGGDNTGASGGDNTNSTGGVETRPRNIAMNYIIRAR